MGSVWTDIPPLNSQAQERLGYPTQKPLALLERIISASSNPETLFSTPSVDAAQQPCRRETRPSMDRIDITHLAISLIEKRLRDAFPGIAFDVFGTPKDLGGAQALANQDKYQFQWWAVSLINAVPYGGKKKGADGGIDGHIYFKTNSKTTEKAVVSVKGGGNVNVAMIRDLGHVIEREKAAIGVFITLSEPTEPMKTETVKAGFYQPEGWNRKFPKIQILTIADLSQGKNPISLLLILPHLKKRPRSNKNRKNSSNIPSAFDLPLSPAIQDGIGETRQFQPHPATPPRHLRHRRPLKLARFELL